MAVHTIARESGSSRSVEKQMRNWELSRAQHHQSASGPQVADFIAISNIVGAGGWDVARALGERLGWPVYDRELLAGMAQDDEDRATLYRSMDERDLGLLEMTLRSLVERSFRKNDYFHRLIDTVLDLARKGPGIFVGRSVDLILPRDRGMRVKLIASMEFCANNFAQRQGIAPSEARTRIARIEEERQAFIRNHFHLEASDPMRFDLLVNVERFAMDEVVELILNAHRNAETRAGTAPH